MAAGQNTTKLTASSINLNGAAIRDCWRHAANLSLSGLTQNGPQIDTTAPSATGVTESPASGVFGVGQTVTLTVNLSEAVTVAGGTPTLTLNDGGVATYAGGSGTGALKFTYVVAAGQNTSKLAATAVNLNGATIKDGAGNVASLSLSGLTQNGPTDQHDRADANARESDRRRGIAGERQFSHWAAITLTIALSKAVAVSGGTPTLTLNDGGVATYKSGSGTSAHIQLHGRRGTEHVHTRGDCGQSQRRDDQGRRRQCGQPVAERPHSERAKSRHHRADTNCANGDAFVRQSRRSDSR